jgi:predicted DNA-binding transcriptional regulator AlpA
VARWVQAGEFPAPIKVQGKVVWPARTIAIWIAWQEIKLPDPSSEIGKTDDDSE